MVFVALSTEEVGEVAKGTGSELGLVRFGPTVGPSASTNQYCMQSGS
jgi:hypothetical protein